MLLGEVVARVWSDRQVDGLHGYRMVQVRDGDHTLVAVDLIGVSTGNRVLVCTDDAAQNLCGGPIDAAVIALVADDGGEPAQMAGGTDTSTSVASPK